MPIMDGLKAVEIIRKIYQRKGQKKFLLSSSSFSMSDFSDDSTITLKESTLLD